MRKGLWLAAAVLGLAVLGAYLGSAAAEAHATPTGVATLTASAFAQEHSYLNGRDGCRKCHLKQYRSWEATPHATAHDKLEGDDANNPECLQCHTTGMGKPGGFVSRAETPKLLGVQCEACHGPGSDYSDKELMKDRDASVAAGLVIPDAATCQGCHNERSPQFKGFDFEEYKAKGVHEISN